jgi:hypothetical protein
MENFGDAKIGFSTKLQSLLTGNSCNALLLLIQKSTTGWKLGLLPEYVLYLDVDTIVAPPSTHFNLYKMAEPLLVRFTFTCYCD